MAQSFNWTCPYCSRPQVVTNNQHSFRERFYVGQNVLPIGIGGRAIACLNNDCKELTLIVSLYKFVDDSPSGGPLTTWQLMPESSAIQQPDYIPAALVEDYYEACRISRP